MTSSKERKVSYKISTCLRSEILSLIVRIIEYLFDDFVILAHPNDSISQFLEKLLFLIICYLFNIIFL